MALLGSAISSEVGLRLLLCPVGSNIVIRTACCSVGIGLPVYSTFKAIERKNPTEQQKWLIYWAAYGSFSLVEVFADKLLSWFPMYYHMKFAFLVWLQLPSSDGARLLYNKHLRPFFMRHQARADLLIGVAYGEMARLISTHQAEIEYAKTMLLKIIRSVDQMIKGESHQTRRRAVIENQTTTESETQADDHDMPSTYAAPLQDSTSVAHTPPE